MLDLNDFYAFNMTSGGGGSSGGGIGCSKALIVLTVIGWGLWVIGKLS